ncbi:discoidin domain-containing protein [Mucilaginibacter psychrotolerans]|uniref:Beta-mannosidase n=1 Tax=Mucilaginibacter psychrotolerans TaxID=1524096 RepID=A0A4Y8SAJ7_9SPHI|nr:discoidin domain-containing protein [Mucilaginibacter psychrotolerans]TFF35474.1 beta-mannosidase [Mucilaginibacter psychrotolerans]
MYKIFILHIKFIVVNVVVLFFSTVLFAQNKPFDLGSGAGQIWKVTPQSDITHPEQISERNYNTQTWVNAIVPGTVFASYVAAGLEKDPNFGDNIYKVDRKKYDRSFWYRTEFAIPVAYNQKKIWLNFKGVNRKADIYLNGSKLGTLDGFMQRGNFDITEIATRKEKNILTVLVYIPVQPLANVGSPNYVSSAGWDWMPYVPGLNSGITDNVFLSNTGEVTIKDPWIRTNLPTNARADISIAMQVKNTSDNSQSATIKGVITPGNIEFVKRLSVGSHSIQDLKLDKKDFEQLMINSPRLWWPNGYGEPNLYNCQLSVSVGNEVSEVQNVKFGIKRYSFDTIGHVLHVAINGVKVFIKGGDWGMSEYLLRSRGAEYDTKVRLHKEMNFNMIRNWIGSVTDEEFYDACDKYGIMVWDDFWLNANENLPGDINVFNANAIEKIKRFRNHPAIAVWCAENEGWPMAPLNNWLREDLATFDGGDRYYQPNSHAENLSGSGPWASKDPRYYFTAYPTGSGGNNGWGLRTELGTAVFTNFESFKKFMPEDKWWPRNEMWNKHFFGPLAFNAGPDEYDEMVSRYGSPKGIEDYCRKAQFVNIETNKAMFEGWQDAMGEDASGLMTWMSQSAYPSLVWQTYDYYYDLTGAYWGAKKACEPLHIQWNPLTNAVKIINTTRADADGLRASADVYNMDGSKVSQYSISKAAIAPDNSSGQVFTLNFNPYINDLAKGKPVTSSSSANGDAGAVNDGDSHTRWASNGNDNEWIYVDLGKVESVSGVGLNWEDAYAKSYKIEVSDDARNWKQVAVSRDGRQGIQRLAFTEVNARYVKMQGLERATNWGYSLFDFEVYQGDVASEGLSDVHFIKLKLENKNGMTVSDNFYWRGNKRKDYSALSKLPEVRLTTKYSVTRKNGKCFIHANVSNPASSKGIAFGVRVQAKNMSTGEQILPAIVNENYFTLFKGESKNIEIEFDGVLSGNDKIVFTAEPFNNGK